MSRIVVILPVHNRCAMTLRFLDSLTAQRHQGHAVEVLVMDDGSTDGTAAAIADWAGTQAAPDMTRAEGTTGAAGISLRVIPGDGSWWWAGAIQRGLAEVAPTLGDDDWVYLGNNDTILDPDHLHMLLETATANPGSVVGARSFEIWLDGHRHPVSSGFRIDPAHLDVVNIPGESLGFIEVDALAGRGMLLPAAAARRARLHPQVMPQHFADIAMTSGLKADGFRLLVDHRAMSDQMERAGSSVEFKPRVRDFLNRRSALYLPAVAAFWWGRSSGGQRVTLPFRLLARGARQTSAGSYALD